MRRLLDGIVFLLSCRSKTRVGWVGGVVKEDRYHPETNVGYHCTDITGALRLPAESGRRARTPSFLGGPNTPPGPGLTEQRGRVVGGIKKPPEGGLVTSYMHTRYV